MKKRVESWRSETGSGDYRGTGPPPSESGRAGAGMAAGKGELQFGEGQEGGKEAQPGSCGIQGFQSWRAAAHQLCGLGQVPQLLCAPVSSAVNRA